MGGFFGAVSLEPVAADLFYGTDYQSHLGTKRGGMATYDREGGFYRAIHNLESTYFRTRFEGELSKFKGNSGIGIISDTDAQPMLMNSHLGRFALVTVAKINNMEEIADSLLEENMHLSEFSSGKINPTELVGLLIIKGKTFVEGIENVYRTVKGSCSMLLLTEDGIIAARDFWGRTPIVIGKKDGAFAATSESTAFPNLGYETSYFVGPGEIVKLKADGMEVLRKAEKKMQVCSFLWIYYGYPVAQYEDINAEEVRYQLGLAMGQGDDVEADFVSAIPDSGIGMALGYSAGKGIPYKRGILKYTPTWSRSFMPVNQESRNLVAKMKLIPSRKVLEGKDVVFCDDSIVRGTQLRDQVKMLYEAGVKHIHIRISCPPLIHGCTYLNFSASKTDMELIARRCIEELEGGEIRNLEAYRDSSSKEYATMVEKIRQHVGVDTLKFNSLQTVCDAIGLPKDQVCTHCFDGSSYDISNLEFNQLEMDL